MKKYIIVFLLAFVFVPVAHGQTVPCQAGDLFNNITGKPCDVAVLTEAQTATLLTVVEELRETIRGLQAQIDRLEDRNDRDDEEEEEREEEDEDDTAGVSPGEEYTGEVADIEITNKVSGEVEEGVFNLIEGNIISLNDEIKYLELDFNENGPSSVNADIVSWHPIAAKKSDNFAVQIRTHQEGKYSYTLTLIAEDKFGRQTEKEITGSFTVVEEVID